MDIKAEILNILNEFSQRRNFEWMAVGTIKENIIERTKYLRYRGRSINPEMLNSFLFRLGDIVKELAKEKEIVTKTIRMPFTNIDVTLIRLATIVDIARLSMEERSKNISTDWT